MSTITTVEKKRISYFREVISELKKVNWTSKPELMFCTKAVILATFFFGFAIYGVDLIIRGVLDGMTAILRMIFG